MLQTPGPGLNTHSVLVYRKLCKIDDAIAGLLRQQEWTVSPELEV